MPLTKIPDNHEKLVTALKIIDQRMWLYRDACIYIEKNHYVSKRYQGENYNNYFIGFSASNGGEFVLRYKNEDPQYFQAYSDFSSKLYKQILGNDEVDTFCKSAKEKENTLWMYKFYENENDFNSHRLSI